MFQLGNYSLMGNQTLNHPTYTTIKQNTLTENTLTMKFQITFDRDEDGIWIAECPAIPGCVSQGPTQAEALANVREAITLCLEVRAERGMPLTLETRQIEVAI
jgi:predicted RNase H-like HicB family nuclease